MTDEMKIVWTVGLCPWPNCGKTIKDHPERHKVTHTKEKPFKCPQCDKAFTQQSNLETHKKLHSAERPFACEQCSQSFTRDHHLAQHMLMHSDEGPHKCEQCRKTFLYSSALQTHKRVHSDERPYTCDECDQRLRTQYDLVVHKRIHSGEKPFVCELCAKTFANQSNLNKHQVVHTGLKPYMCHVCLATFSQKGSYDRHQLLHTPEGQVRQKKSENRLFNDLKSNGITIDQREQSISFFCISGTFARVDFVIQKPTHIIMLENDEEQHKGIPISCELSRMTKLYAAVVASGETRSVLFLRFNPHSYMIDGDRVKTLRKNRIAKLIHTIETYTPLKPMEIIYLFYDVHDGKAEIMNDSDFAAELKAVVTCIS